MEDVVITIDYSQQETGTSIKAKLGVVSEENDGYLTSEQYVELQEGNGNGGEAQFSALQAETVALIANITSKSAKISQKHINIADNFVVRAKAHGYFSKGVDCGLLLGESLIASSCKLIKVTGAPDIVWNNFGNADYDPKIGVDPALVEYNTNGNKFGDLGIDFTGLGLTPQDCSLGLCQATANTSESQGFGAPISNVPTSPAPSYFNVGFNGGNNFVEFSPAYNPDQRVIVMNSNTTSRSNYVMGMKSYGKTTPASLSLAVPGNICLFKGWNGDTAYPYYRPVSAYFIGKGLTDQEAEYLSQDLVQFMVETERIPNKDLIGFFGDSIMQGGTHANTATGLRNFAKRKGMPFLNLGAGSTRLVADYQEGDFIFFSGFSKYEKLRKLNLTRLITMYGTNDISIDSGSGGIANPSQVLTFFYRKILMIRDLSFSGIDVLMLSIPWRGDSENTTKVPAYNIVERDACIEAKIPFINTFHIAIDTGNPGSYFPDNLHPTNDFYELIIDHINARDQGKVYRDYTFDFPSIGAGLSATINVDIDTAKINDVVTLGQPANPIDGLVYTAFVSALNVVTVKATNTTTSAINTAAQVIRVTVNV